MHSHDGISGYCFGANDAATVVQDPIGLLRWLCIRLDIALTPFIGRWGIPMGPPKRSPLLLAFGDPISHAKIEDSQADIREEVDVQHKLLLDGFMAVFQQHKALYGWSGDLRFV